MLFFRHQLNHYYTHHTFISNSVRFSIVFNIAMHCKINHIFMEFFNESWCDIT